MNKINFTAKDNFPLSSDTMDIMQKMIELSAKAALLGGSNYILSGCTDSGTTVSDGVIVINGELLKFEGGVKKSKITILQTSQTLHAFGVDYPEAYIFRTAKFSDTGEYNWLDFKQIESILQLSQRLNEAVTIPKGLIAMWSGDPDEIPQGWMLCDGSNNTPNLSGMFIVGFNRQDTDYNSTGKSGGLKSVTLNLSQIPSHSHTIKFTERNWGDDGAYHPWPDYNGVSPYVAETQTAGGGLSHENRPPYYVLAYIIKL